MEQITKIASKNNLAVAGAAVAVAGAAIAAGQWISSQYVPHGPVQETYEFNDEEKDHGGILVGKVLLHHNVKCASTKFSDQIAFGTLPADTFPVILSWPDSFSRFVEVISRLFWSVARLWVYVLSMCVFLRDVFSFFESESFSSSQVWAPDTS
jgi:hypothetical protein